MPSRIRVLAVTNHYPSPTSPGDAPCIRDQIQALDQRGIDVEVLAIDRSRRRRSYLEVAARVALTSLGAKRYDIIHAFYGYAGLLARMQMGASVVVTFRGSDLLSRRNRRIGPAVARIADAVVVMSTEMKRVSGRADAQIIPFGVNLQLFSPAPKLEARAELGLPLDEKLVLFPWAPSRPEKRFDIAHAAVEELGKNGAWRIIPVTDEPPARMARYMNACDALILVSDREGAPMAVREALACNLPVVSVDVGDVRQVIDGVDGCFLCRREVGDVACKLRLAVSRPRALDGPPPTVSGADRAADAVIDVYETVLRRSRPMATTRFARP